MGGVQNANLRLILTLDFGTKAAWIKLVESGPNSKQSESLDLVTSKRLIVLPVSCPSIEQVNPSAGGGGGKSVSKGSFGGCAEDLFAALEADISME